MLKGFGLRVCMGITDRGLTHLVSMSSLEWLDLRRNPNITDQGTLNLTEIKKRQVPAVNETSQKIILRQLFSQVTPLVPEAI